MSEQQPTVAEILARLKQALPVGDFDYDDGYRDGIHSVLLALAQAGVSRQALDDAITTALDAHANNAPEVARKEPSGQPPPGAVNLPGATPFGVAALQFNPYDNNNTRLYLPPRRESSSVLPAMLAAAEKLPQFFVDESPVLSGFPLATDTRRTADGRPFPPLRIVPRLDELTDEDRDIDTDTVRDAMTLEYEAWMKLEGLDLTSADEHLFDSSLTLAQLEWVREFTLRWERNDQIESLQRQEKRSP